MTFYKLVSSDSSLELEDEINALSAKGWELFSIYAVTDPKAPINVHYALMKRISNRVEPQ